MIRVGQGIDIHPFDESRPLILGGVRISDRGGLSGHSDADAVLHALTDALLGAAGAGDIGQYFPSDDPRWKGASSTRFVEEAKRIVDEMNAEISNVDITIIAEKPKLAPFREDALSHGIVQWNEFRHLGIDLQLAQALGRGNPVIAVQDVVRYAKFIQLDRR